MQRRRHWWVLTVELLALAVLAGLGYRYFRPRPVEPVIPVGHEKEASTIESLVVEEELILALTPRLKKLDRALSNLSVPDNSTRDLFTEEVTVVDLSPGEPPAVEEEIASAQIGVRHWNIEPTAAIQAHDSLRLLRPFVDTVSYVEQNHFYFVDAKINDASATELQAKSGLGGLARTKDGQWRAFKASLEITWRRRGTGRYDEAAAWRIAGWRVVKFETQDAPRKLFAEVLDRALPNPADLHRARQCLQEEYVVRLVKDPNFVAPHPQFFVHADDRHPGLAVVDIDQDGWDDLYVMDLWGRNLLLRNRGDGTFEDVAPRYGLDLRDHCSCAVFADFDNDGDPDLFLGRTLERCMFLRNEDGQFVDRSESLVGTTLPYFASSVNAVDIDNDGLLDVYISTYAANQLERLIEGRQAYGLVLSHLTTQPLLVDYLDPADALELGQRNATAKHVYTDRAGPPNLLLSNRGGKFEVADANDTLQTWRNTFQTTWGDYDGDGDQDCYVSNDFAPNNLFRNEGHGKFVDATDETGTADIGFGMGASWGDYDEDGRQDLYVSNMYSKAGRRITGKMGRTINPNIARTAGGNTLFRNDGAQFEKVSGVDLPSLLVEAAGWSWGSQFVDVDSDGCLDLFALSGFYSASREIAIELDL